MSEDLTDRRAWRDSIDAKSAQLADLIGRTGPNGYIRNANDQAQQDQANAATAATTGGDAA